MQPTGINPALGRVLVASAPDLLAELFLPGRILEADVTSVFEGRAVLAFGRGIRLEVALQTQLQEGQRVRVQVQPGEQPSSIVLKLLTADTTGQTNATPVQQTAPASVPGQPQLFWLPIPLPDGTKGWAQLQIQEDSSPKARSRKGGPVHKVRIWWETPALGPVQVAMEAGAGGLSALFTSALAEIRRQMEGRLPDLQERLIAAGFEGARLGCRAPAPGETVEPARQPGAGKLDRRM